MSAFSVIGVQFEFLLYHLLFQVILNAIIWKNSVFLKNARRFKIKKTFGLIMDFYNKKIECYWS